MFESLSDKLSGILDGLTRPTAIEPTADILWVGDRAKDKAIALPMPK